MNILIAGDFCPRDRVSKLIDDGKEEYVLGEVKDVIAKMDYSIVNFECPITNGEERPITKCGPNLSCSEKGVKAIKWAGFDCVTLANNHFYDYGDEGVNESLLVFDNNGIDHVGGGRSLEEASRILFKEINGCTLAIINCCEHEFSIATDNTGGANPLNPIRQYYDIQEAKSKADYVLVIIHGGPEHWQLPSPRMTETYRFFIDAGADVVVNHHQHCFSGYELYRNKPIFYGLGNLCFDSPSKRNDIWNEGYMVKIVFKKDILFEIIPYTQCDKEAKVSIMDFNFIKKRIDRLNRLLVIPNELNECTENYYFKTAYYYGNVLEPIRSRYYLALKKRGLLPSLISNRRKVIAENYICCESHRDKLIWWLKHN